MVAARSLIRRIENWLSVERLGHASPRIEVDYDLQGAAVSTLDIVCHNSSGNHFREPHPLNTCLSMILQELRMRPLVRPRWDEQASLGIDESGDRAEDLDLLSGGHSFLRIHLQFGKPGLEVPANDPSAF